MKITFKDVGQGDSIILEWEYEEHNKVGIIDCKMKGRSNPVIEHIKNAGYKEIEFIILSHPHSDHYSGLEELLTYCNNNKITIQRFCHTLKDIDINFYRWFEPGYQEQDQLVSIIKLADSLSANGILRKFVPLIEDWSIDLSETIRLQCYSPSHSEIQKFHRVVKFDPKHNKKAASKACNYLSTVFHLSVSDNSMLLTSDAEIETFQRIYDEKRMKDKLMGLGQAPHHGSFYNYLDIFWDELKFQKDRVAVVSSGLNAQYQHPHLEVLNGFKKNGYVVHATNIVYGMKEYTDILKKTLMLDTVSDISEEYLSGGDKTFEY